MWPLKPFQFYFVLNILCELTRLPLVFKFIVYSSEESSGYENEALTGHYLLK